MNTLDSFANNSISFHGKITITSGTLPPEIALVGLGGKIGKSVFLFKLACLILV